MLIAANRNSNQNVNFNVDSVKQNANVKNYNVKTRCNVRQNFSIRSLRCVNDRENSKIVGFFTENIVFYKMLGRQMRGIAKILSHTVAAFVLRFYVAFVAHHFAFTFLNTVFTRFAVWRGALKIRVSLVRFQSRPPFRTVVLLCSTAVFLFKQRVSLVKAYAVQTFPLRCCDFVV